MPQNVNGTFANARSAGPGQTSQPLVIPSHGVTTMLLSAVGLSGSNTVKTQKTTNNGYTWTDQTTYSSDQANTAVTVAAGEQWRLYLVSAQALKQVNYSLSVEGGGGATGLDLSAFAYNWTEGNTAVLKAMLLASGSGTAADGRAFFEGTSVISGSGAMGAFLDPFGANNNMTTFLKDKLVAGGLTRVNNAGLMGCLGSAPTWADYLTWDARWATVAGAPSMTLTPGVYHTVGGGIFRHSAATVRSRFTPGITFNRIEIFPIIVTSGVRSLSLYGGTGSTLGELYVFETSGEANATLGRHVTTLANGSTVLEIEGGGTASNDSAGFRLYNTSSPGMSIINCGWNGALLADRSMITRGYFEGLWFNYIGTSTPTVLFYDPSTINDVVDGTNMNTWLANAQDEMQKRVTAGFEVHGMIMPRIEEATGSHASVPLGTYDTYSEAFKALCLSMSIAVTDFRAIAPTYAAGDTLGYYRDQSHPTSVGYDAMAEGLAQACLSLVAT